MAGYCPPPVQTTTPVLIAKRLQWISGGTLIGAAAFSYPGRDYLIIFLLLFLPLGDRYWRLPSVPRTAPHYLSWASLLLIATGLLVWHPSLFSYAITTLILAALPEEWFFRAYFMSRLGGNFYANLVTSGLFSLMHGLTRGWWTALQVFVPSLLYGWLYQRTGDLPLLVIIHALSNLIFVLFLMQPLANYLAR